MNYKIMKVFYYTFLMITAFAFLAASLAFSAELSGPESVQIGQLATFTADIEGDAILVPAKGIALAKDSNRKAFYVAAQAEGEFTFIFFGVENGAPVITQKSLTVGTPEPEPTPEPQPTPIVTGLTETEKTALRTAADAVVRGIQSGTVRQPNHARMEFKRIATKQLGGKVSDEVQVFLKRWTDENAVTTLDELKATFTEMREELK